jgi:hypothetical protein
MTTNELVVWNNHFDLYLSLSRIRGEGRGEGEGAV